MRPLNFLLFFAVFMCGLNFATDAHEYKMGDLEVVHPWARAQLKGSDVADGFMKIINHGTTPDRLIGITVDFAKTAQIHDMKMDGSTMQMVELKDGVEIPAGATVELKPKAMHVMFLDLSEALEPDELIPGELIFEKAGKLKVEFMIEKAGTASSMDNM